MKRRLATVFVWLLLVSSTPWQSRGATHESFEGPETSWQLASADCQLRIAVQERRFADAHAGRGCEFIQMSAGQGTAVYLAHEIPPATIIPELIPSVWVKADRSGIQFLARVVFPRSLGSDGQPLTSLLAGDSYDAPGTWRQLRIPNLLQRLQREAWNLRTNSRNRVDEREAYIDRLVLNLYSGPGTTNTSIDDLELQGFASAGMETRISNRSEAATVDLHSSTDPVEARAEKDGHRIAMQGTVLVAGGRPLFVRAIEYRGETMAFLQSLGFNVVLLSSPATDAQLAEAIRSDIWLISPPPFTANGLEFRSDHRQVLAWFLGERLTEKNVTHVTELVQQISRQDTEQRPVLLHVASGFSQFRYERGVTVLDRSVLGTSFELRDFGQWLEYSSLHGRVDAPFWAAIATELPGDLRAQITRLGKTSATSANAEPDQVRLLSFEAVARGARGLWFRSGNRLDGQDSASKVRAAMLHALNRELELVAPWAAGGSALGEKATSHPHVRVFALQTTTSRLLIVSRLVSDQQYVSAPLNDEPVTFTVHGTPISDQAYKVAPQGIESIPAQRGGGIRVTLDGVQPISLVMLTQDPLAVNYMGRISADIHREYAACQVDLAEQLLDETKDVDQKLSMAGATSRPNPHLVQAQADVRQAVRLFNQGDARGAIHYAGRGMNGNRRVRREHWESAVLNFSSPMSSPLCATFSTLPLHQHLASALPNSTWSVNVLAAGDMENLEHLLQSGWRQSRADVEGVTIDVRLSLDAPLHGRSSLQLRVWNSGESPARLEGQRPIAIHSAPITVREGQLVRIHGWAKVPKRLDGSCDGLMIFDSQTGEALAERISETQGWREFVLYRVATSSDEFKLVFAHTGLGESWIDNVSVTVHEGVLAKRVE